MFIRGNYPNICFEIPAKTGYKEKPSETLGEFGFQIKVSTRKHVDLSTRKMGGHHRKWSLFSVDAIFWPCFAKDWGVDWFRSEERPLGNFAELHEAHAAPWTVKLMVLWIMFWAKAMNFRGSNWRVVVGTPMTTESGMAGFIRLVVAIAYGIPVAIRLNNILDFCGYHLWIKQGTRKILFSRQR